MSASLHVHIRAIRYEAQGILSYELRPPPEQGGAELPPFTAGAPVAGASAWSWIFERGEAPPRGRQAPASRFSTRPCTALS